MFQTFFTNTLAASASSASDAEVVIAESFFYDNAWIIPALPAASFLLILFFGKKLPKKGAEIGIAAVGAAFILALLTSFSWIGDTQSQEVSHEEEPEEAQLDSAKGETAASADLAELVAAAASSEATEGDDGHHPAGPPRGAPVVNEIEWFGIGAGANQTVFGGENNSHDTDKDNPLDAHTDSDTDAAGNEEPVAVSDDHSDAEPESAAELDAAPESNENTEVVTDSETDSDSDGDAVTSDSASSVSTDAGHDVDAASTEADAEHAASAEKAHRPSISIGTLIDGQSVMMLFVVTFISLLVHVYSTDYVNGDRRYTHYFAFLSLFTSAMLFMVLSVSTIQLIVGWELVGVCSFVLIGHWWEEKPNSDAALKAFLTNRVGDVGLLIGVSVLYFATETNTFSILEINEQAASGAIGKGTLTVAAVCLMAAVMSKSGQFILHTWLPDAMAGPTPVSALIHAATMVVAGVYMIGRLYPVFFEGLAIAGSDINLMAFIGGLTTVGGGVLAFVQRDIKKVLAYSTVSQLGYMVLALGMGAYTAALFHLFTHAFFKACLFLGAGSVSHACHHSFDMKADMGGLRKYMPKTFATFIIGSLALAGIPPLAGFWSKDEILAGAQVWPGTAYSDASGQYVLPFMFGIITAALTAAYMTRVVWLTFFGTYRGDVEPHESGKRITVPLMILATMATLVGFLNMPSGFVSALGLPKGWAHRFQTWVEPENVASFPNASGNDFHHANPSLTLAIFATSCAVGASALVWRYYSKLFAENPEATEYTNGLASKFAMLGAGHKLLVNKFYLDHLYTDTIAAGVKGPLSRMAYWFNQNVLDGFINLVGKGSTVVGGLVYRFIDQGLIDGSVNGSGKATSESGEFLRRTQSGQIRQYATLMFGAAAVLAAVFIFDI